MREETFKRGEGLSEKPVSVLYFTDATAFHMANSKDLGIDEIEGAHLLAIFGQKGFEVGCVERFFLFASVKKER